MGRSMQIKRCSSLNERTGNTSRPGRRDDEAVGSGVRVSTGGRVDSGHAQIGNGNGEAAGSSTESRSRRTLLYKSSKPLKISSAVINGGRGSSGDRGRVSVVGRGKSGDRGRGSVVGRGRGRRSSREDERGATTPEKNDDEKIYVNTYNFSNSNLTSSIPRFMRKK